MAKNTTPVTENAVSENENSEAPRTNPMTVGPSEGGSAVFAAWRGLANLAGASAERFDVTPDGVVVVNLTFDQNRLSAAGTSAEQIVHDVAFRGENLVDRRLDLIELFPFAVNANHPVSPYTEANEMTQWMVNSVKGAGDGDGSRSPEYAKKLIAAYKEDHGIAAPRGRKRKIIRLDNLGDLKSETIADVPISELEALKATIIEAIANQQGASAETVNA